MRGICVALQRILTILEQGSVLWETLDRFETHTHRLQVGRRLRKVGHIICAARPILADIYWFMAPDKCLRYNIFFKGGGCPVCMHAVYHSSLLEQYLPNAVNVEEILCKGYPKGVWLDLQF